VIFGGTVTAFDSGGERPKKNRKQRKAAATRRVRKRAMSGGPKIVRTKTTKHLHRPRHYETKLKRPTGLLVGGYSHGRPRLLSI